MAEKLARVFLGLLLEAVNEFILHLHDDVTKKSAETQSISQE